MKEIKNEYAVNNMVRCLRNAKTYASYLDTSKNEVEEEIEKMQEHLRVFLINHAIIPGLVRKLQEFAVTLQTSLNSIGNEYATFEEVCSKLQITIWDEDENRYFFNTEDGLFSGVILRNEHDYCFELQQDEFQIWDEETEDWRWKYRMSDDTVLDA
jgi:hypothetical protein